MNVDVEKVSLEGQSPEEMYKHLTFQKLSHDYLLCKNLSPESFESLKTVVAHIELLSLSCVALAMQGEKDMFDELVKNYKIIVDGHIKVAASILNGKDKQKESMI